MFNAGAGKGWASYCRAVPPTFYLVPEPTGRRSEERIVPEIQRAGYSGQFARALAEGEMANSWRPHGQGVGAGPLGTRQRWARRRPG
jgi:hypothetical protein